MEPGVRVLKGRHIVRAYRSALGLPPLGCLAVFACVALSTSPAGAQDKPACSDDDPRILGVVVDHATGQPLANTLVSIEASEWASLTTEDGRFLLCGVGEGTHLVTAEQLGYATFKAYVETSREGDLNVVRMRPDPILLEGLEVVTDRFERRRKAVATTVRAFDQEDLARSGYWTAAEFISSRAGVFTTICEGGTTCVYRRGRKVNPTVYLDEFPLIGGWFQLETLPTSQLYMIEVYSRGAHIRAYTHGFMERAAKVRLAPFPIWY